MQQDAVTLLQPSIVYSRICGVCPSSLRELHTPTINKILAITLALVPLFGYETTFGQALQLNDITAFVTIVFWISLHLKHWAMLITPFLTREDLVVFFEEMEAAQQTLFSLNIRQPPVPSKRSQIAWIVLSSANVVFIALHNIISGYTLAIPVTMSCLLVEGGSLTKLRVMLDLMKEKLDLLNWHLDDLNNRWPLFLPRPPDVTFSEFTCVANWRRTKFVHYDRYSRHLSVERVQDFNKAHFQLFRAYRTLNRLFSLPCFIFCLYSGLYLIYGVFRVTSSTSNMLEKIFWFIGTTSNTFWFLTILTYATRIKKKFQNTAILVHDLLDEEENHSEEVLEELEEFSQSLLHRKVCFSAAGFFDVDLKLVSRMASLVAPMSLFIAQNDNRPRGKRPT